MDNLDWRTESKYKRKMHCCGPKHRGDRNTEEKYLWRHPLIMGSYCWNCRQLIKIANYNNYKETA